MPFEIDDLAIPFKNPVGPLVENNKLILKILGNKKG